MKFLNEIIKPTIIICSSKNKEKILEYLSKNRKMIQINFMTLKELSDSLYFKCNEESFYYVMKKYNVKYDVAERYINNLVYVEDKVYDNKKLDNLVDIKKRLSDNHLLEKDNYFNTYIKNKDIIFYGFDYIDAFMDKMINDLSNVTNVKVINKEYFSYEHKVIKFNHIEDEVEFVATKICELVNKNIDINNIKLTNIKDEYLPTIKRIFKMYNIPVNLDDQPKIFGTMICKEFLDNFSSDLNKIIDDLKAKYNGDVLYKIIDIVNKYAFVQDKMEVKEMMIHDLASTNVSNEKHVNAIEIVNIDEGFSDDEYIFMLNFNMGSIPKVIKDEDYLSDKDRILLGLESTIELNKKIKESTIKNINSIKNLIITYKLESYENIYFPSILINDMHMETIEGVVDYSYSDLANKIKLCKGLDRYLKYNVKTKDLSKLYSSYSIPYLKYNNNFSGIDKNTLKRLLNNKLSLSYSSLQTYEECSFKYYVSNILGLDVYEDTFSAFIGSLFHHVLERGIKKDIDVPSETREYIKDKVLTNKEKFFINKLIKDISLALKVIKYQLENSKFKDITTESKIEVIKKGNIEVVFKGFIDKIMSFNNGVKTYAALVDYKTYSADVKLDLLKYGLNIQLPVYLYLASNKLENVEFVGFYVQRILSTENKYEENELLENQKIKNMKLCGYSIDDPLLLEMFDKTYADSEIINGLKLKQDGSFSASSNVLSKEKINEIIELTDKIIDECIENIENGKFDINPKVYKESNISCKYCKYRDLCFTKNEDIIEISEEGEENA